MNLRKLLNLPTKLQKSLISLDIENVLQKCDVIANAEYKEQKEAKDSHDNFCDNCHARKDMIVNKISHVQGIGKINSSFVLGYGKINGSISIDTHEISHCTKCGNEWKKYKIRYVSKTNIIRVVLNYLGLILEDPDEKKFSWKLESIGVFNDCYLETIIQLSKTHKPYLNANVLSQLKSKNLKKYYKSIFNDDSRKLEKI